MQLSGEGVRAACISTSCHRDSLQGSHPESESKKKNRVFFFYWQAAWPKGASISLGTEVIRYLERLDGRVFFSSSNHPPVYSIHIGTQL